MSGYQRGVGQGGRLQGRAGLEVKVIWGFSRKSRWKTWSHEGSGRERGIAQKNLDVIGGVDHDRQEQGGLEGLLSEFHRHC